MQLKHEPRLDSGSRCHSVAASLATVSDGALSRIEVSGLYTDPIGGFSSANERLSLLLWSPVGAAIGAEPPNLVVVSPFDIEPDSFARRGGGGAAGRRRGGLDLWRLCPESQYWMDIQEFG